MPRHNLSNCAVMQRVSALKTFCQLVEQTKVGGRWRGRSLPQTTAAFPKTHLTHLQLPKLFRGPTVFCLLLFRHYNRLGEDVSVIILLSVINVFIIYPKLRDVPVAGCFHGLPARYVEPLTKCVCVCVCFLNQRWTEQGLALQCMKNTSFLSKIPLVKIHT